MKTTLEMPEGLYRRLKSHAAQRGISVKQVVTEAVQEKLKEQKPRDGEVTGWRAAFGTVPASHVRDIDRIIEKDFGQIDPADWK